MSERTATLRARLHDALIRFRAWRPDPLLVQAVRETKQHAIEVAEEIADEHAQELLDSTDPEDANRIARAVYLKVVVGLPLEQGGTWWALGEQALAGLAAIGTWLVLRLIHAAAEKRVAAMGQADAP